VLYDGFPLQRFAHGSVDHAPATSRRGESLPQKDDCGPPPKWRLPLSAEPPTLP